MKTKIKIVAIIPARGGSKRIPNKNIKLFNKKPLISYAIEEAKRSKVFDKIIVSTDSPKIKKVALKYGAEVPFKRPKQLSKDVPTEDVVLHAVKYLEKKMSFFFDIVVVLEPPHIARRYYHIKKAIKILKENFKYDSVMTVLKIKERPEWMLRIKNKFMTPFIKFFYYKKKAFLKYPSSKEFETLYKASAIVYAIRRDALLKYKSCTGFKCYPIKIKQKFDLDLDHPEDWAPAEKNYKRLYKK
jgi:CMP-N,N'-diacetyllegionaminic acid synthase